MYFLTKYHNRKTHTKKCTQKHTQMKNRRAEAVADPNPGWTDLCGGRVLLQHNYKISPNSNTFLNGRVLFVFYKLTTYEYMTLFCYTYVCFCIYKTCIAMEEFVRNEI